jgi:hypothetical protein
MLRPDGRSLWVTSDRSGGFGGEDIYVTSRDVGGNCGPLIKLGSLVNGSGNDQCPIQRLAARSSLSTPTETGGLGSKDIWWRYFQDVSG